MTLLVLDTDTLTLLQEGNPNAISHFMRCEKNNLVTTVISVEERLAGWYSILHRSNKPEIVARNYEHLAEQIEYLSTWRILRFPVNAIARYQQLVALRLNIGKSDLKIAAIVLENNGILVTRNRRDFERVPNLQLVDWMQP